EFQWGNHRPLIEVNGLQKDFKTLAGPTRVLKDIHLEIRAGEFVSIIGRSGSGKSTLINMLTGIDHPTAGTVRIGDTVLEALPEGKMAEWRGKTLGIVFQFFQLLPTLTLMENVLLPMDFCRMYPLAQRLERAVYLLSLVGLADWADMLPGAVSGGQQQCAAVARALSNDPPILVADEPTGNLDSASAEGVLTLFETLVTQGKTILMVTHDRNLAKRAGRQVLLSDGVIVDAAVVSAFAGLADEKLLQLSQNSMAVVVQPGDVIEGTDPHGSAGVLVVRKGALRVENCFGLPESISTGEWLDLRWMAAHCPGATLAVAGSAPVEVLRIDGDYFDSVAGPHHHFDPNRGLA
ncbi:MAG TPA: ABC transporter ATP-binding protein, partial [Anaerolinea sp.]|nr:ABC transporter ATP-binding protein [Anaerolinea sp.]